MVSCCSLPSPFILKTMTPELEYGYAWHYSLCFLFVCLFLFTAFTFFSFFFRLWWHQNWNMAVSSTVYLVGFLMCFCLPPVQDYAAEAGRSLQDGGRLPAGIWRATAENPYNDSATGHHGNHILQGGEDKGCSQVAAQRACWWSVLGLFLLFLWENSFLGW